MVQNPEDAAEHALSLLTEESQKALQKLQEAATSEAADVLEVALLRRQLEHQRQETANAMLAANELRRQIQETTEAQNKKAKKAWSMPGHVQATAPELTRLQTDVHQAKAALEKERRARRTDLDKASEEIEQLRSTLRVTSLGFKPKQSSSGTARAFVTVVVLLAIASATLYSIHKLPIVQSALSVWDVKEEPPVPTPKTPEAIASDTIGKLTSFAGSGSEFSRAIARLDRVLNSFPGKPQDVLTAVRELKSTQDKTVCGFEWANGQPAIVYEGNKPGNHGMSISTTVNSCAEAVEQFLASAEKESLAKTASQQ